MDPVQIPVPPDTISIPTVQTTPTPIQQDDLFDKFLKKLVAFIGKVINKSDNISGPTIPLGVSPQTIHPSTPKETETMLGNIGSTIGNVANQAVNVANQVVNVAGSGVNSVVKGASEYISEPVTPAPTVDVQDFLSQNYQSTPTTQTVPTPETPSSTS